MEQLKQLRDYKSRFGGTSSAVTLIIPPNSDVPSLIRRMKKERQTASNIKSASNRKSVIAAISSIIDTLKTLRIPDNGIALFAEQCI